MYGPSDWLAQHPGQGSFSIARDDDEAGADEQDTIARSTFIATLVEKSRPINGTPGEHYLRGRGIELSNLPLEVVEGLRWLDNCRGEEGALLVKITDEQGEVVGIALTYVTLDGRKSSTQPVRQIFRGPPDWRKRGLVRFKTGFEASTTLYLVEGVEKALALIVAGYPRAAATLGVGAIGRAYVPRDIQKVVVVRDGDPPGSEADRALHCGWVRLLAQGVRVRVTSTPPGEDANSVLNRLWS